MSVGQELKPCHFGKKLSIYNTDDMTFVNFINSKQVVFSSVTITILLASPSHLEGNGRLTLFCY